MVGDITLTGEAKLSVSRQTLLHISRQETDTLELCKPKIIRKRNYFFGEKVVLVHYRGPGDIHELKLR